jgi:hypothetical protein
MVAMTADWIARLAEDERRRDEVRNRASAAAQQRASLARVLGGRLIDELRAAVTRDIGTFRQEFPSDQTRVIVFDDSRPDGGFFVEKRAAPAASLEVNPRLENAVVSCRYLFTSNNGLPAREDRVELMFAGDQEESFQIKNQGTGQVYASVEALSEYLLVPVFTGRPR